MQGGPVASDGHPQQRHSDAANFFSVLDSASSPYTAPIDMPVRGRRWELHLVYRLVPLKNEAVRRCRSRDISSGGAIVT